MRGDSLLRSAIRLALPTSVAVTLLGCVTLSAPPPAGEGTVIVLTQLPAQSGPTAARRGFSLDERYPPGSRIVATAVGSASPADVRILSEGFAAAGAPVPSPGLRTILFAGRRGADSRWGIYEVRLDRAKVRPVIELERDCGDPAYLAHGRLAFVCDEDADRGMSRPMTALYTASVDGTGVERITFGAGSAFDPVALEDGRLLFSMWQGPGVGRRGDGAASLFTVNPDGSMIEPFSGSHRQPAFKFRPQPTVDRGVIYLAADRPGGAAVIERVELARPLTSVRTLPLFTGSGSDGAPLRPASVRPLPDGALLVAGSVESTAMSSTSAVYRAAADAGVEVVFDDPLRHEVEAVPLIEPARLRGRPSALDPGRNTGTLICYDAARSDGIVGPADAAAHPSGLAVEALMSPAGPRPASRRVVSLGEIPVHADGSVLVDVPADVPIRVLSLADDDTEIATSEWFWLRPGEVRACFGCHENREAAPVNRFVQALEHPPARLGTLQAELAR